MKLKIKDLQNNNGQVPGINANPRTISEKDFEYLKQSLKNDPDFIKLQPLLLYDNNGQLVVMGGNQRLRAMQELGWTEFEHITEIMPAETPAETILARIIKHNSDFGKWDWEMLGNEWDDLPLEEWGIDAPAEWTTDVDLDKDTKEMTDKFDGLFGIIINCKTEEEQLELLERLTAENLDCRTINAS